MDHQAGDGPLAGYQARTFPPVTSLQPGIRPPGRRPGLTPPGSRPGLAPPGRRPGIRPVGRDRALAVGLACLAAAVLVGMALSHSPGAAAGGYATPGLPQPASQLPQPGATSASPVISAPRSPDQTRGGPGRRTATMQARPKPATQKPPTQSPATQSPATQSPATQSPATQSPAVVVRYLVTSRGPAGFEGEIQVTNNTAEPIGNWQIVVTLYDDAVTSVTNADGFFSSGILLLSPASPAQVVPPDGGVLDVFFTADGFQTIPAACAFDGTYCGY
jgi:Cellulose binding domain